MPAQEGTRSFDPKDPPKLNPPKDDPISVEELAKCDGTIEDHPTYVAIKGTVFDVSANKAYAPKASYHELWNESGVAGNLCILAVFAGKDASRALAQSSLKIEDCRPEYEDLEDKDKKVLHDWFTFFSKRYNIVGKVQR